MPQSSQSQSLLDYPLDIRIKKLKLLEWVKHVPVFRESCLCAETELGDHDETLITIFYPLPAHCPYEPHRTIIMLLNHEVMHNVFEDVLSEKEGEKVSYYFDDPYVLKLLADILPDQYCYCEDTA